ncbi:hypothetical protein AVEN_49556-1 [Araneus ventricosus]|uniref:Uncharacterized protein n=1 Tax=Araneus ventricosus TaxID=182803 RepID=A0A4Y2RFU3_ARAVE|nr:hypothetical protein AVEN_49556-1 [Araneus ventricosus]
MNQLDSVVFQLDFNKIKEIDVQYPDFVAVEYVYSILKKMQGVFAFLLELDQWNRENSKLRERPFKDKGNSLAFSKPTRTPKHSPNSKNSSVPQTVWASHSTLLV